MNFKNIKTARILITFVLILKYIMFLISPVLGSDGPWSLSSTYSYINGLKDQSVFAHNFLGKVFTFHFIDFIYSLWFKIFPLSTYSFISLGFIIIVTTVFIWLYIAAAIKINQVYIYLLALGYVISPYTYGFRPEGLSILFISMLVLTTITKINPYIKIIVIAGLTVSAGLVHHVAGVFAVLIGLYYMIFMQKKYIDVLIFTISGIIFGFLLTNFHLVDYLLLPLKFKSEVDNHLSGFDFSNISKYFIYSGGIILLVIILFRKYFNKFDICLLVISTILFSYFGRSYYVAYYFPIILFLIVNKTEDYNILIKSKFNLLTIQAFLLYAFVFILIIPIVLTLLSSNTNSTYKKTLDALKIETKSWNENTKYYSYAPVSLEIVDKPNARLLYSFMMHNDGIQNTDNKVFYITTKKQLDWIYKNFDTKNKHINIKQIIPETEGNIIISSIYKFKIIRTDSIGLWKVLFEN